MYAVIVFLLCSMIFHHIMLAVEKVKLVPPGRLIKIDGHTMHISGSGQGLPTVVMTCGSGTPSAYTEYSLIGPMISGITRTCIYERPGYGWSESASTSRDTEQIVSDLHRLLKKAGEQPPYVFIAHSMGAMEVLLYTQKYPNEVEGIIFVDGTSPFKHIYHSKPSIPNIAVYVLRILNRLGVIRIAGELGLITMLNRRLHSMPKGIRATEKAMLYKNILNGMVLKEGDLLAAIAEKMYNQLDFGDLPLIIYAADWSLAKLPGWQESQESLLRLSTCSKMVIVKNSNHISILQEHADEIIVGIKELIYKIRESKKISESC